MLGMRAIKAALAAGIDTQATDDLIHGDARFFEAWQVTTSVPGSFAELNAAAMFTVLRDSHASRVVEIGSYLGRSTIFFAKTMQSLGVEAPSVVAIDPHTGDRQQMAALETTQLPSFDMFRAHLAACRVTDIVRPIVKQSSEAAEGWRQEIDFLYIDGWHSYAAVMRDGRDWLPHLSATGVAFFDDYSRYADVSHAVTDLVADGTFTLWGNSFGQAVGGRTTPPEYVGRLLKLARARPARRVHRLRER